jgi:hypothetical protein
MSEKPISEEDLHEALDRLGVAQDREVKKLGDEIRRLREALQWIAKHARKSWPSQYERDALSQIATTAEGALAPPAAEPTVDYADEWRKLPKASDLPPEVALTKSPAPLVCQHDYVHGKCSRCGGWMVKL